MASIGELTATVRADVSGFVGPMQQVVSVTQKTASQVQSITAPTQQLGAALGQTATAGKFFGVSLTSLRGSLASLASGLVGVPGPLGNIASKLAMFGAGGGITVAVLAGVAAIIGVFRKLTEETRKQEEAVDDLKNSYDEMFGAAIRLRLEQARDAVARLERGRTSLTIRPGARGMGESSSTTQQIIDTEALEKARQALTAAERAYAAHLRGVLAPAEEAAAKATKERTQALNEMANALKDALKIDTPANSEKKASALTKEARAWQEIKAGIVAATEAERQRAQELPGGLSKAKDNDIKSSLADRSERTIQAARNAANTMAQAFMSAFGDKQESIAARVGSVLRAALMDAIQKLIAQKIFEGLLSGLTGGAPKSVLDNIPIIGNLLGSAPQMASSGGTLIVPLDNLPPPLSPVEVARDVMHQTVWMETARMAESNGWRLQVRTRG